MLDIINPWGALRRAQRVIAELLVDIEELKEEREYSYKQYKDLMQQLERSEELIGGAHFRNPKTGRIGPVGETFHA